MQLEKSIGHQKACASWNLAGRNYVSVNIISGSAVFWLLMCPRNLQGLIRHKQWDTNSLLRFPFPGRLDILHLQNCPAFSIWWKQNKCNVHTTRITWQGYASSDNLIKYSEIINPHASWRQKDCILQKFVECWGYWSMRILLPGVLIPCFKISSVFCYPLQLPVASSSFFQSSEAQPVGLFSISTEDKFQSRSERPLRAFSLCSGISNPQSGIGQDEL